MSKDLIFKVKTKDIKIHPLTAAIYRNGIDVADVDVEILKGQIKATGFMEPVVINRENVLISGYKRFRAALELGLAEMPMERKFFKSKAEESKYVCRENFNFGRTNRQKVEKGIYYEKIIKEKAHQSRSSDKQPNFKGALSDIVAKIIGGWCGKTYKTAKKVVAYIENLEEEGRMYEAQRLSEKLNKSVHGAYKEMVKKDDEKYWFEKDQENLAFLDRMTTLESVPDFVYCMRGEYKANMGDLEGAEADFDTALKIKSKSISSYVILGWKKSALGNLKGAWADLNKAIEIDPEDDKAYLLRGQLKLRLGAKKGGIADLDRAVEVRPKYSTAYLERGRAKYALSDYIGAIVDFDKTLELDPESECAYFERGYAKYKLGNYIEAMKDFFKAWEYGIPEAAERMMDIDLILRRKI